MSVLDGLAACAGRWHGTSTLQDPHADIEDESPSTLSVTPMIGGRFVRIDYAWSYGGAPQEGALLIGYQHKAETVTAHWMDSFHNGETVMVCTGTPSADGTITVRGSYAAPTGPDWGWRIDITPGGDALRIVHHNVWPEGKEELAVDSRYTPA
jgi:hypothetical protein